MLYNKTLNLTVKAILTRSTIFLNSSLTSWTSFNSSVADALFSRVWAEIASDPKCTFRYLTLIQD